LRLLAGILGSESQEGAHCGQLAGGGGWAKTTRAAICEEGAQVSGLDVEKGETADLLASVPSEELGEAVGGRDIGANRVSAAAAVVGEMSAELRSEGGNQRWV
jgi:hypothetical protein